jgi:hypothetical protein
MGEQKTGQELTGAGAPVGAQAGVGGDVQPAAGAGQSQPIAQPAPAIAGVQGAPAATGAQPAAGAAQAGAPEQKKPVDLSQFDEFKKFQSDRDRREAQLRREMDALRLQVEAQQQRQEEQQRRADELAVKDLDPEERAEYYRQQAVNLQQQQQQTLLRQEEQRRIAESVYADLQELGISPDDPGLNWPQEQTWETAKEIVTQAAKLAALRARTVATETTTQAAQVAREAGQQALVQAGVSKVAGVGGAAPGLREEFEQRKKALVGTGQGAAYLALKREFRKKGLDV